MARVTVEDCLEHVENRFHLVMLASRRARQLELTSADPLVPADNDKPTVLALREIAAGKMRYQVMDDLEKEQRAPKETSSSDIFE